MSEGTQQKRINIGAALYVSAERDHSEPVPGRVRSGSIPAWLSGSLIRNGPGLFEVGDTKYKHFFDGLALLRKFSIANGRAEFTSQFLRSDAYTTNMAYKRIVIGEFGTRPYPDPCKSWLGRFASMFWTTEEEARLKAQITDNTLVNVFPIGDQVFAATETTLLNRIDPNTLDRLDLVDLKNVVPINTMTAHPHFEADGGVLNLGTSFRDKDGPKYVVVRIPPDRVDQATVVATIPARWRWNPAYYHSFGVTQNYIIFAESPLALSIPRIIAAGVLGLTFDGCLQWHEGQGTLLHVMSRSDGRLVQTFKAKDFFTFHHMNAFEDAQSGEIKVDLCAFRSGEIIKRLSLQAMQQLNELPKLDSALRRYHLKLGASSEAAYTEPAGRLAIEFPQINYRYNGLPYRYGYGVGRWLPGNEATAAGDRRSNSSIVKLDWQTEQVLQWHADGWEPSEAVFVEHPDRSSEDHGLLLASLIGIAERRSLFLIILDARTLAEVAKVDFDGVSIPFGFHGMFFSEEQMVKAAIAARKVAATSKDE